MKKDGAAVRIQRIGRGGDLKIHAIMGIPRGILTGWLCLLLCVTMLAAPGGALAEDPFAKTVSGLRGLAVQMPAEDPFAKIVDGLRGLAGEAQPAIPGIPEVALPTLADTPEEALLAVDRAIALSPDDAALYARRAECLMALDRYGEAIAPLTRATELDPANARYYAARGDVYSHLESWSQAVGDYAMAAALGADDPETFLRYGRALCEAGQFEEAIRVLDQAEGLSERPEAYGIRGLAYGVMGEQEEALENLTRAIAIAPYEADYYTWRGHLHADLGRYQEAVADYRKAIIFGQDDLNVLLAFGNALYETGHYRETVLVLDLVLRVLTDGGAYKLRGMAYRAQGEYERAYEDMGRAVRYAAGDPYAYYERAVTAIALGRYDEAAADLNVAERLGVSGAEIDSQRALIERGGTEEHGGTRPPSEKPFAKIVAGLAGLARQQPQAEGAPGKPGETEGLFSRIIGGMDDPGEELAPVEDPSARGMRDRREDPPGAHRGAKPHAGRGHHPEREAERAAPFRPGRHSPQVWPDGREGHGRNHHGGPAKRSTCPGAGCCGRPCP